MAGYIMTMDSLNSLEKYIESGIYSTKIKVPSNNLWHKTTESTVSDFTTMKHGDNIYFFHKREIYGVGEVTDIDNQCIFLNFPEANHPKKFKYSAVKNKLLLKSENWGGDEEEWKEFRWLCTFKPSPYFFKNAVDMDAALQSDPKAFKMLRAFQGLSFIKIDDFENQALKNIILKRNESHLKNPTNETTYKDKSKNEHSRIKKS